MFRARLLSVLVLSSLLLALPAVSQTPSASAPQRRTAPRLVAVAETKLLMEGLTQSNFQGMEKILKQKDVDAESWAFARGQALLIAETGNLLMLRPPKNTPSQDAWMRASGELRESASQLAKTVATRDLQRSRAGLTSLATACNSCHQTFRVPTKITAFGEDSAPKP